MKVLVVGGAGYIGSHVVKDLLANAYQVEVLDNFSSGLRSNIPETVKTFEVDIMSPSSLDSAIKESKPDAVIHLAALKAAGDSMVHPEEYSQTNIQGSINLINAISKHQVKYVVFSSSAAVYGSPEYLPMDEKHPRDPDNFYGYTKVAIEDVFNWYSKLKGIRLAHLRYFNAAGYDVEGQIQGLESNPSNLLPIVMETAVGMRESMSIFGDDYPTRDGTCIRDYIHVNDLADAHTKALYYIHQNNESLTVNLGTGQGITVLELIQYTEELLGHPLNYNISGRRDGDPSEIFASAEQANIKLGWKAQYSDMKTLVQSTLQAYRDSQK